MECQDVRTVVQSEPIVPDLAIEVASHLGRVGAGASGSAEAAAGAIADRPKVPDNVAALKAAFSRAFVKDKHDNDAVLAIMELRRRDWKVAYVDIDAHHGDGVQFAFYTDPRVLTISSHERGDRLFPGTGFVEEIRTFFLSVSAR